jgi:hypothetical protein
MRFVHKCLTGPFPMHKLELFLGMILWLIVKFVGCCFSFNSIWPGQQKESGSQTNSMEILEILLHPWKNAYPRSEFSTEALQGQEMFVYSDNKKSEILMDNDRHAHAATLSRVKVLLGQRFTTLLWTRSMPKCRGADPNIHIHLAAFFREKWNCLRPCGKVISGPALK